MSDLNRMKAADRMTKRMKDHDRVSIYNQRKWDVCVWGRANLATKFCLTRKLECIF